MLKGSLKTGWPIKLLEEKIHLLNDKSTGMTNKHLKHFFIDFFTKQIIIIKVIENKILLYTTNDLTS